MGAGAATAEYISETWVPHDSPPAHDEGYRLRIGGREITDAADWDRAYGTQPLWQEAQGLLGEGYTPEEAATELRLRYGRQVTCTGDELVTAITQRGGTAMAKADWKTPGVYDTRPLWQIAAELHDEQGMSWEQVAVELKRCYGIDVSFGTVADRAAYYQGQRRGTRRTINWQTPGVYDRRPLVEVAAALYDENEGMTWSRVVEILKEQHGIETDAKITSRTVAKWRREGGEVSPSPQPPPPGAINGMAQAGEGEDVHAPECECGDCINRREHEIDWTMDDEEDPFDDGGEEDGGPSPVVTTDRRDACPTTTEDGTTTTDRRDACPTTTASGVEAFYIDSPGGPVGDRRGRLSYDDGAQDVVTELLALAEVQREAMATFAAKNADYGASYRTHGAIGLLVRIGDKLMRCQQISSSEIRCVRSEALRDTLLDLHNYAAMAIMELDRNERAEGERKLQEIAVEQLWRRRAEAG